MQERPDYVPRAWTMGRVNTWMAARPQRVLAFFLFCAFLVAGLAVWAVTDPHDFFAQPVGYVAPLTVPLLIWQAAVYVPRAIRAMRRG